ncbi:MAG: alpha/beta hydrolase [Chloroflexia bacterium]
MPTRPLTRAVMGLGGVASAGVGLYAAWLRSKRLRLAARSRLVQTPLGPLEYAEAWSGPPVLVAHGILGGWDQGMLITQLAAQDERNLHVISVSRWGYLRSPMPRNPAHRTHEAQADAYASLLDTIGIDRVAMVGISGGGPSAIQFALRHPDRIWALVSIAGVSGRLDPGLTRKERALLGILNNDLGLLTLRTFARERVMSIYGMTPERLAALRSEPDKLRVVEAIYFPHPLALRRGGFALDLALFPNIPRYPVERIGVPTLAVHGSADSTVPFSHSQFLADNVPGARLLTIEGGGHLSIVTHKEVALTGVYHFLQEHAPSTDESRRR